jgi:hypothetical protein
VVIAGDEDDLVDALGLERVLVVDVGDYVLLLAGRREGARDGDYDDLLVGGFCSVLASGDGKGRECEKRRTLADIVLDTNAARGQVWLLGGVGYVGEGYAFGEGIAGLEGCHFERWDDV